MHVQIGVKDIDRDEDDFTRWSMKFIFSFDNKTRFIFEVYEPYLHSIKEWRDLADGKTSLFYFGDDKGNIQIKDDMYVFVTAQFGASGDVSSEFYVPFADVSVNLHNCLDFAVEQSLSFETE